MLESKSYSLSELINARRLFSKDLKGKDLYRIALEEKGRTPQELVELRKEFGEGQAGQLCFMYIAVRSGCELLIENEEGKHRYCGNEGKMALYFDAGAGEDLTIVCSEDHYKKVLRNYYKSIESQGISGVPSRNGFGRV